MMRNTQTHVALPSLMILFRGHDITNPNNAFWRANPLKNEHRFALFHFSNLGPIRKNPVTNPAAPCVFSKLHFSQQQYCEVSVSDVSQKHRNIWERKIQHQRCKIKMQDTSARPLREEFWMVRWKRNIGLPGLGDHKIGGSYLII